MNRILKILGICVALSGLCGLVLYLVLQKTVFHDLHSNGGHNEYEYDQSYSTPPVPAVHERTISEEVPDSVSDRGIILRGPVYDPDSDVTYRSYRQSPSGTAVWFWEYVCDRNLLVESTDSEFREYCEGFSEFGELSFGDDNGVSDYGCTVRIPYIRGVNTYYSCFRVFRTCLYPEECSEGGIWKDAGDGAFSKWWIYFDPTGRYLLLDDSGPEPDDFMLAFLEPQMISVDITGSQPGEEAVHLTDSGDVKKYVDAMHELEVMMVDEDRSELAMAENYTVLSFTDENGKINDYKIVGEYLIHHDDVYHIENREALDELEKMLE